MHVCVYNVFICVALYINTLIIYNIYNVYHVFNARSKRTEKKPRNSIVKGRHRASLAGAWAQENGGFGHEKVQQA